MEKEEIGMKYAIVTTSDIDDGICCHVINKQFKSVDQAKTYIGDGVAEKLAIMDHGKHATAHIIPIKNEIF